MSGSVPLAIAVEIESYIGSGIKAFSPANGGCINRGGKITTVQGVYFLKWNELEKFPGMFEAEAQGLKLLRNCGTLSVPRFLHVGRAATYQFILMEYIEEGRRDRDYWAKLGVGLGSLHRSTADAFGLDHDNYIGSLIQHNKTSSSWVVFFIEQRLKKQLQLALDKGRLNRSTSKKFQQLFEKLPSLLPNEPPSLLHGDLWGGNIMTTSDGQPCLIDPAVYYGHREVDLAMTQLFGGFDASFLESYDVGYPLLPGYQERLNLYNLYPLLVHVNLFGGGYLQQVVSVVNRFV